MTLTVAGITRQNVVFLYADIHRKRRHLGQPVPSAAHLLRQSSQRVSKQKHLRTSSPSVRAQNLIRERLLQADCLHLLRHFQVRHRGRFLPIDARLEAEPVHHNIWGVGSGKDR